MVIEKRSEVDCSETAKPDASQVDASALSSDSRTINYSISEHPTIGNYKIVSTLGSGGMGTVYLAEHLHLTNRQYALKVLRPSMISENAFARFQREIKVVSSVAHENLVYAIDAGYHDQTPYLVMDFVNGCDLQKLLSQHGPIPYSDACEMIRQACLGIDHAHHKSIVHRDLKPSNLMLDRKGRIKVLDLGLALLRDDVSDGGITNEGVVMGSSDFMAPEQWNNPHQVQPSADIYSLGCTLFALLAGKPPFAGRGLLLEKMNAHVKNEPPTLSEQLPDLPLELSEIVQQALKKSSEQRIESAREFASRLEPFCHHADLYRYEVSEHNPDQWADGTVRANATEKLEKTLLSPRERLKSHRRGLAAFVGAVVLVALACLFLFWPTLRSAWFSKNASGFHVERLWKKEVGLFQSEGVFGKDTWHLFSGEYTRLVLVNPRVTRERCLFAVFTPGSPDRHIATSAEIEIDGQGRFVFPAPTESGAIQLWEMTDGIGPHLFVSLIIPEAVPINRAVEILRTAPWSVDPNESRAAVALNWYPNQVESAISLVLQDPSERDRAITQVSTTCASQFVDYIRTQLPACHLKGIMVNVEPLHNAE